MTNISKEIKLINEDPYVYGDTTSIDNLEKVLRSLSHHYYNSGKSLVSDLVFDALKDILQKRDPKNDFLKQIGAPVEKNKIKLPHWMGSLDKITPDTSALEKWKKDYTGDYLVSDKLDGVSALLIKQNDVYKLYTRGDGNYGVDISHLIPLIFSKKITNNNKILNKTAVRGELIISKKNFKKISHKYANGRNAVAGLVNSKNYSELVAQYTEFVAYSMYFPIFKISDQLDWLIKHNFNVVNYKTHDNLDNDTLSKLLISRRSESDYEIDGLVIMDNKIYPTSSGNPKSGFAFKAILSDQMAEVKVVSVNWNISMDARLVPTVTIEPVKLVGVTITNATAHNAKFIVDNTLGAGAVIKIIRSKDVIPYIQEVISPALNNKPSLPKEKYIWSKSGVDIFLKDPSKFQQVIVKQIAHFFKTMEIKHISQETIKKLVEAGYKNVPDLIQGVKNYDENILKIDGIGEKMLSRIVNEITLSIQKSYLFHVMAGSKMFGRGLGVEKLKLITQRYPDIINNTDNRQTLLEKILQIDGFDLITADKFVDNLGDFKVFHNKLKKVIDLTKLKTFKTTGINLFKDEKVVFTGFRDKELKDFVETNGGKVSSSVTSRTTMVVYSDTSGSKYKKAVELKLPMYSYDEFLKKYKK